MGSEEEAFGGTRGKRPAFQIPIIQTILLCKNLLVRLQHTFLVFGLNFHRLGDE